MLSSDGQSENGIDIHAGSTETSRTLFLQPQLVHDDYKMAVPQTASSVDALAGLAETSGWPGYFGSPRLASAAAGARLVEYRTEQVVELALRILDGFDWRSLPTRGDRSALDSSYRTIDDNLLARSEEERRSQEEWIKGRTQ